MKVLTKILGLLVFVFSLACYQASPIQWGHGRGHGHGPKKYRNHRPHRPHYKSVRYRRPPGHYYKRHYRPVRHRYYSRPHRVYYSRPVVVVRRR